MNCSRFELLLAEYVTPAIRDPAVEWQSVVWHVGTGPPSVAALRPRCGEVGRKRPTPIPPRHANHRRKRCPSWAPTDRYRRGTYHRAIGRACEATFTQSEELVKREGKSTAEYEQRLTDGQSAELKALRRARHCHRHHLRHNITTLVAKEFGRDGPCFDTGRPLLQTNTLSWTGDWRRRSSRRWTEGANNISYSTITVERRGVAADLPYMRFHQWVGCQHRNKPTGKRCASLSRSHKGTDVPYWAPFKGDL